MGRRVRITDLRNAAAVAKETGTTICVEGPDGTLYRITPDVPASPLGTTEREIDECDKAFGLSE